MRERVVSTGTPATTPTTPRKRGFAGIIGQKEPVERLRAIATLDAGKGTAPVHTLMLGEDGIGKRTIARAFAEEHGRRCIEVETGSLSKTGDLLGILTDLA